VSKRNNDKRASIQLPLQHQEQSDSARALFEREVIAAKKNKVNDTETTGAKPDTQLVNSTGTTTTLNQSQALTESTSIPPSPRPPTESDLHRKKYSGSFITDRSQQDKNKMTNITSTMTAADLAGNAI
jgi:hypothetical protein